MPIARTATTVKESMKAAITLPKFGPTFEKLCYAAIRRLSCGPRILNLPVLTLTAVGN